MAMQVETCVPEKHRGYFDVLHGYASGYLMCTRETQSLLRRTGNVVRLIKQMLKLMKQECGGLVLITCLR